MERLLATVGLAEINGLAALNITDANRVVLVSAPDKAGVPVPSSEELEAVFAAVARTQVEAYVDETTDAPLMAGTRRRPFQQSPRFGSVVAHRGYVSCSAR